MIEKLRNGRMKQKDSQLRLDYGFEGGVQVHICSQYMTAYDYERSQLWIS